MNLVRSVLPFLRTAAMRAAASAGLRLLAIRLISREIDARIAKLDINDNAERVQIDVLSYVKDRLQLLV